MADVREDKQSPPSRPRGLAGTIWALEHAQDYVAVAVGILLIALAVTLILSGIVKFFGDLSSHGGVFSASILLIDRILLVLILGEIVHTVVLSLREHRLVAQPFIVVGLVAVIRKILFVLSSEVKLSTTQLSLYIAMVLAFVAGLIAVSRFEKHE